MDTKRIVGLIILAAVLGLGLVLALNRRQPMAAPALPEQVMEESEAAAESAAAAVEVVEQETVAEELVAEASAADSGADSPAAAAEESDAANAALGEEIEILVGEAGPEGGQLFTADGRLRLDIPAGALSEPTEIQVSMLLHHLAELTGSGLVLSFELKATTGGQPATFKQPLALTFAVGDLLDLATVWQKPELLHVERFDPVADTHSPAELFIESEIPGEGRVMAEAPGIYRLESGSNLYEGWKLLFNDAQVVLFSGAATYSIPIEVPQGRNGLTPQLALNYNSRRMDGITAWVQSDWVGLGWSVDTPQIVRKINPGPDWMHGWAGYENKFSLLLGGASYELVPETEGQYYGRYHTDSEAFLYIERRNKWWWCATQPAPETCDPTPFLNATPNRSEEYWIIRTTDGTSYRLGFNLDSEQLMRSRYYSDEDCDNRPGCWTGGQAPQNSWYAGEFMGRVVYRWRVDQVGDTVGNEIVYGYEEQNDGREYEYASYPAEINYTSLANGGWGYRVRFERGRRGQDDTIVDGDFNPPFNWPRSVIWFQSDYLKSIHVEAHDPASQGWSLVRRYDLTYERVADNPDAAIEGRQLKSVTQVGYDGVTTLPPTTFSYALFDNKGWACDNPPLPEPQTCTRWDWSSFEYARLIGIDNGYGGRIELAYGTYDGGDWNHLAWNYRTTRKVLFSQLGEVQRIDYDFTSNRSQRCYDNLWDDGICDFFTPGDAHTGGNFIGFGGVRETLKEPGPSGYRVLAITDHTFRLNSEDDPSKALGRGLEMRWLDPQNNNALLKRVANTYGERVTVVGPSGEESRFIYLSVIDSWSYDGGVTVQTRVGYNYDDFGNVIVEHYAGDPATSDDDKIVMRDYIPNTDPQIWILNRPRWERVYAGSSPETSGAELAMTAYGYDGEEILFGPPPTRGLLTGQAVYHTVGPDYGNPANRYETTYTYDSYGNLETVTDPLGNITLTEYDPLRHIKPVTITNALGQTTITTYHPLLGIPTEMRDPNNAVTLLNYDVFGRLTKVARPGDTLEVPTIAWHYTCTACLRSPQLPGLKIEVERLQVSGEPNSVRSELYFYDGLGRLLQTRLPSEAGTQAVTNIVYDARGQVMAQYAPVGESFSDRFIWPEGWHTRPAMRYTLDALGRPLTVTGPDGSRQSVAYRGRETATLDANGRLTLQIFDTFGQLIQVRDYMEVYSQPAWPTAPAYTTTNYRYDLLGNLVQVQDAAGHLTQMSYNPLGWKLSMSDPNMGIWHYTYDPLGRLLTQTDAMNRTLGFEYDAIGRLKRKTAYPGSSEEVTLATMTYDDVTVAYGIGQRRSMQDSNGTRVWAYDERGRVMTESQTLNGLGAYVTGYEYSAADQLIRVNYPTGESVATTFNNQWLPASLNSNLGQLVENAGYNARGQMLFMQMGNGTQATFAYADEAAACTAQSIDCSLRLVQADLSFAGVGLFHQVYQYDSVGNLVNLTDGRSGFPQETFDYVYDGLNRLTAVKGDLNESYAYDLLGNITQAGDLSYQYSDPTHPQAVTETSDGRTYAYDPNGNMIVRAAIIGGEINIFDQQWNEENQLARVTNTVTGESWTQRYDGDGLRVGQVGPDELANGIFAGGLLEDHSIYFEDLGDGLPQTWEVLEGTWTVQNGEYVGLSRTTEFARSYRQQVQLGAMTFSWTMRFLQGNSGGLNFFADTIDREESYLVRQDGTHVRVFRAHKGEVIELAALPATNAAGQTHRYQVTIEPALGRLTILRDGTLLGWQIIDTAPERLTKGAFLFLVTNNAQVAFDDIRLGQITTYYHLGGQRVALRQAGLLSYLHGDHLGSSSLVTCGTADDLVTGAGCGGVGAVVAQTRYEPFGQVRQSSGDSPTDFGFTGQRLATGFGLIHMGARWYDPQIGRWTSADAIVPDEFARFSPLAVDFHEPDFLGQIVANHSDVQINGWFFQRTGRENDALPNPSGPRNPQVLNRYTYVLNNPLRYLDPTGHDHFQSTLFDLNLTPEQVQDLLIEIESWLNMLDLPNKISPEGGKIALIFEILSKFSKIKAFPTGVGIALFLTGEEIGGLVNDLKALRDALVSAAKEGKGVRFSAGVYNVPLLFGSKQTWFGIEVNGIEVVRTFGGAQTFWGQQVPVTIDNGTITTPRYLTFMWITGWALLDYRDGPALYWTISP